MEEQEHFNELTRLLSKLLDESIDDDELARLEQWLQRDRQARQLYMQYVDMEVEFSCMVQPEGTLHDPMEEPVPLPEPAIRLSLDTTPSKRTRGIGLHWRWFVAAAVLLLALGVWVSWQPFQDWLFPASARLAEVQGEVEIIDSRGRTRSGHNRATIQNGDIIHARDASSSTSLKLADGTHLQMQGKTKLVFLDVASNQLDLKKGTLKATVTPQSVKTPLRIKTPKADVEVLGTQFTLIVTANETELKVTKGRVRFTHKLKVRAVIVAAGEIVWASQTGPFLVQKIGTPRIVWHEDFEEHLPRNWDAGQWVSRDLPPGSYGGVQAVRAPKPDEDGNRFWFIATPREPAGLFRYEENLHLHFTYMMKRPGWTQIFLHTRDESRRRIQNFLFEPFPNYAGEPLWQIPANRWYTATVPFNKFLGLSGFKGAPTPKHRPLSLFFSSQQHDRGLILDRIWVTRGGPGEVKVQALK